MLVLFCNGLYIFRKCSAHFLNAYDNALLYEWEVFMCIKTGTYITIGVNILRGASRSKIKQSKTIKVTGNLITRVLLIFQALHYVRN